MKLEDVEALLSAAYSIVDRQRLPNDKGTQLKLQSGQKVNVFDTGTWNVPGPVSRANQAGVDPAMRSSA